MTQKEAVIETFKKLGGIATLGQLNQEVFKFSECQWKTKTPFASIRRIVQESDEIYRIKPGLWALCSYKKELEANGIVVETPANENSEIVKSFNHSYYQGLLVEIGNIKKLKTFVPEQDKNKKYSNTTLKDIRSLERLPSFSYESIVKRSSTIDVIWFNHRMMPHSFFEVEHSTDIQNSLIKYCDLQDFYCRMIIVADKKRKDEFYKKYSYEVFSSLRKENRVVFIDYESVHRQYNQALETIAVDYLL